MATTTEPALSPPLESMPLRADGRWRKRWRYVAAFDERFMLCAAAVEVGPARQTFWALWDRDERRLRERTCRVVPLVSRPEVEVEPDGGRVAVRSGEVRIELEIDPGQAVEAVCPAGGAYTWTQKLVGAPVRGSVAIAGREHQLGGRAVTDISAGYHARRTSWRWSAGVGEAADGRAVAWNLVEGINDPAVGSERAIWIDGAPSEPGPVHFDGLESIRFGDGSTMSFSAEARRARRDRIPFFIRSDYEAPFGSFSGEVAGIPLAAGKGVMERHDAIW